MILLSQIIILLLIGKGTVCQTLGFDSHGTAGNRTHSFHYLEKARELWKSKRGRDIQEAESLYASLTMQKSMIDEEDAADLYVEFSRFLEDHHGSMNSSFDPFSLIRKAAELGQAEAQYKLAAMYGSGLYINSLLPMDAGRSLLLLYTAALSGSPEANVAVGYRFFNGIGVPESCELARKHYEYAANFVVRQIESRGFGLYIEKRKLSDDYQRSFTKRVREVDEEIVDYYKHLASEGDTGAAMSLATMYITGSRVLQQDFDQAIKYLNYSSYAHGDSASASGLLGYLLIQGFGSSNVRQSIDQSAVIDILKTAAKHRDPNGIVGLGLAHERGLGVSKNISRAAELYQSVLNKHQDAGYYLGELYMSGKIGGRIDISAAMQAYASASQKGNTLSLHRLGHMSSTGLGLPKHCPTAVNSFKTVAERGDWMASLTDAHKRYRKGEYAFALMTFSRYAALGEESSQFNVAEILSKHFCPAKYLRSNNQHPTMNFLMLNSSKLVHTEGNISFGIETDDIDGDDEMTQTLFALPAAKVTTISCQIRALQFYSLSASQNDAEAMLRIGDMHYYGFAALPVNKIEAAKFYQLAADMRNSHANFNLGVMYEAGDGVEQDFHLAKRFFDQAADFDPDARLPRSFALFLLSSHRDLIGWLGHQKVDQMLHAINPVYVNFKVATDHYFSLGARIVQRWLQAQQSSMLSMQRGVTKPGYLLMQIAITVLRVSMGVMDTVLQSCRIFIVHAIVLIWRITTIITGQPSISTDDVLTALKELEEGSDIVNELENYLIIICTLLLLFIFKAYRMRRRERALINRNAR